MRRAAPLLVVASLLCPALVGGCGSQSGDPHSDNGIPPIGGKDKRISDVGDPGADGHAAIVGTTQAVSGALVVAVDNFDETGNGKSAGTIYVQDLGSTKPFAGTTLFAPTFNPGNLAVNPGDVLDLRGQYTEAANIGATVVFAPGAVLPQMSKPVATFRYETQVPDPLDIDVADLADYTKGRQWMGMLVRVKNITLQDDAVDDPNGRVAVNLSSAASGGKCNSPFPKPASLTNDLFDLAALNFKKGDTFATVTGVVGYFCNLHLAPRTAADLVKK